MPKSLTSIARGFPKSTNAKTTMQAKSEEPIKMARKALLESRSDCTPMVVTEAMAHVTPMIATDPRAYALIVYARFDRGHRTLSLESWTHTLEALIRESVATLSEAPDRAIGASHA